MGKGFAKMSSNRRYSWPDPDPFPVREDWLCKNLEAALEPDLEIIDPHHHLWHRQQRYLLEELLADFGQGHNIVSSVFVQAHAMYRSLCPELEAPLGETEFVNGIAAIGASGRYGDTRFCEGIIGYIDLRCHGEVDRLCEQHLALSSGRFKGVRNNWQWSAEPALPNAVGGHAHSLLDADFGKGLERLAAHGLSLDTWLFYPQLPDLVSLARAHPDLTIILNHLGGIVGVGRYAGKRSEIFDTWSELMRDVATCPNVVVKFGGFGMPFTGFGYAERPCPPSSEEMAQDWRPYFEICMELLGAKRIMFESNFPADKTSFSYPNVWNAFKRISSSLPAAERRFLFSETARITYRLP